MLNSMIPPPGILTSLLLTCGNIINPFYGFNFFLIINLFIDIYFQLDKSLINYCF